MATLNLNADEPASDYELTALSHVFEKDRDAFLEAFATFVARNYGPRCDAIARGCPVCEMWKRYDGVKAFTD